jgi:DnaK suppressor protein
MIAKHQHRFADELARRRFSLLRRLREQERRVTHPSAELGDWVDRALHEIDLGTEHLLMEMERRQLERLLAAEQRLKEGRFGTCRRCGAAIDPRRLRALPETVLCVECAREREARRTIH